MVSKSEVWITELISQKSLAYIGALCIGMFATKGLIDTVFLTIVAQ